MKKTGEHAWFYWIGWQGLGLFCWFMWGASSFMSYLGLITIAPGVTPWMKVIAAGMSIGINFVEFMFNRMTIDELREINDVSDIILRMFGVVCYLYDIFTNVIAFIAVVSIAAGTVNIVWVRVSLYIFASFFGFLFAVGPEPTYIKFLKERTPFPGFGYTPKYKGAVSINPGTEVSPTVLAYLQKKAQEARNAQR